MKTKLVFLTAFLFAVPVSYGQYAEIIFANRDLFNDVCSQVFDEDQVTPLEGGRYQAQLWYRKHGSEGPLIPHTETAGFRTGTAAGFNDAKLLTIPELGIDDEIDAQMLMMRSTPRC